jgi:hypothetical protein
MRKRVYLSLLVEEKYFMCKGESTLSLFNVESGFESVRVSALPGTTKALLCCTSTANYREMTLFSNPVSPCLREILGFRE